MESLDAETAWALLDWQVELGADEAIGDVPVDRYTLDAAPAPAPADAAPEPAAATGAQASVAASTVAETRDPVQEAEAAARAAGSLEELRAAMQSFDLCELKRGARSLVFCDGVPGAPVMVVGEAPGREEDLAGKPFVGRAGQMLDRMLAAIGLARSENVYITNVLPWRPPQNRDPRPEEIAMMRPFLDRHIALAGPEVLIAMGNISCQALLGKRGITRLRGAWTESQGRPVLPMFHPAYLLRQPLAKREAWADLLSLKDRLRDG